MALPGNLCSQAYHLVVLCMCAKQKSINFLCIHHKCVFRNEDRFNGEPCWQKNTRVNKMNYHKLLTYFVVQLFLLNICEFTQTDWLDETKKNNVCMSIHDVLYEWSFFKRNFVISTYFNRMLWKKNFTSIPVKIDRILDWCTRVHKMPYNHKSIWRFT